jgi:hypothetical protein
MHAGRAEERWRKQKALEKRLQPLGADLLQLDMGRSARGKVPQRHSRSAVAVLERWLDRND